MRRAIAILALALAAQAAHGQIIVPDIFPYVITNDISGTDVITNFIGTVSAAPDDPPGMFSSAAFGTNSYQFGGTNLLGTNFTYSVWLKVTNFAHASSMTVIRRPTRGSG